MVITSPSFQPDWSAYYAAMAGRPPRETLMQALALIESEGTALSQPMAIDLGCGEGRDSVALLQRGWHVLAIDAEPEAIARLQQRAEGLPGQLETQQNRFETLTLPPSVDLINASFSLPFCLPDHFAQVWQQIVAALRPGGWFCGQLFGDRDSWATIPTRTHLTRDQAIALLQAFEIKHFHEEEHPGTTALGHEKYWHLFHIVAQKR